MLNLRGTRSTCLLARTQAIWILFVSTVVKSDLRDQPAGVCPFLAATVCNCQPAVDEDNLGRMDVNCSGRSIFRIFKTTPNNHRPIQDGALQIRSDNRASKISLRTFDLSENKFQNMPARTFNGLSFQNLNLSGNRIAHIDAETFREQRKFLLEVNMEDNLLNESSLNGFGSLIHLNSLYLSGNRITVLKAAFLNEATILRHLDISRNNVSSIENHAFQGLRSLKFLDLSQNEIKMIRPGNLLGLPSLSTLQLTQNRISTIYPGSFDSLPRLKTLDLSQNDLRAIDPSTFRKLASLEYIFLQDNQLRVIPAHAFRHSPKLYLAHLQRNQLTTLEPNAFSDVELGVLSLSNNQLTFLDDRTFQRTSHLSQLYMQRNQIRNITSKTFRGCPRLVTLDLSDNLLERLPVDAFESNEALWTIDVSGNKLTTLHCTMSSLPRLNELVVSKNPLTCDCRLSWLREWSAHVTGSREDLWTTQCAEPEALSHRTILDFPLEDCHISAGCTNPHITMRPNVGARSKIGHNAELPQPVERNHNERGDIKTEGILPGKSVLVISLTVGAAIFLSLVIMCTACLVVRAHHSNTKSPALGAVVSVGPEGHPLCAVCVHGQDLPENAQLQQLQNGALCQRYDQDA